MFNVHIKAFYIGLNDVFFDIDDTVKGCIGFFNENDGFTIIGWYKRSDIMDQTMKN